MAHMPIIFYFLLFATSLFGQQQDTIIGGPHPLVVEVTATAGYLEINEKKAENVIFLEVEGEDVFVTVVTNPIVTKYGYDLFYRDRKVAEISKSGKIHLTCFGCLLPQKPVHADE